MKTTSKAAAKFERVMHEFGQGKLKSHDKPVTDKRQALAIAYGEARQVNPNYGVRMMKQGGIAGNELQKIYETGTSKQLWDAWSQNQRNHFIIDHSGEFFELMDDDFNKSAKAFITLTYDTLPSPIRKSLIIHHAIGMYRKGGPIETAQGVDLFEDYENIPHKVKKILDKYQQGFEDGDYAILKKALEEVEKQGYTFEYYLDGQAYDLRKIGEVGKVEYAEKNSSIDKDPEVYLDTYRRKYVLIDKRTQDPWANEFFTTEEEAKDFAKQNKIKVIDKPTVVAGNFDYTSNKTLDDLIKSLSLGKGTTPANEKRLQKMLSDAKFEKQRRSDIKMNNGGGIPGQSRKTKGAKFEIGDKVMVEDTGYVKKFEGFDLTKPATIRDINKSKSGGKIYYFYKLQMANGDKPFNQAEEDMLTLVSMGGGGLVSSKLSPAKKQLQDRINTLKATKASAGEAAQKAIQKKIDNLQAELDYNPSAKQKVKDNQGKFALDVPEEHSKFIYKKLWSMDILPKVVTLGDKSSIVVNSKINLEKAYDVYSDRMKDKKQKPLPLSKISRKV